MSEKNANRASEMGKHIEACKMSGIHVEQYCKEHKLNTATYYYWRKKLATPSKTNTGSFIQVLPIEQRSGVEIVFTSGVKIYFENLVPIDYLKQLVH